MSAFLQQLPALIGVVVGALGSILAIMLSDQARFRREQAAQWSQRRLDAYSSYSRALKEEVSISMRVAAHLGNGSHPHPLAPAEAFDRLGNVYEARDIAWESMLLLGRRDVITAAEEWFRRVVDIEHFVREEAHDPDKWSALLDSQRVARTRFYDMARRDLAVPAGTET